MAMQPYGMQMQPMMQPQAAGPMQGGMGQMIPVSMQHNTMQGMAASGNAVSSSMQAGGHMAPHGTTGASDAHAVQQGGRPWGHGAPAAAAGGGVGAAVGGGGAGVGASRTPEAENDFTDFLGVFLEGQVRHSMSRPTRVMCGF